MLVNLKEILEAAEKKESAVGAFNTPNLTSLRAVIGAAEELQKPVILMHAQVHEEMGLCSMEEIAPIMLSFARRASVPVCVHLDHGTDLDYIKRGLALGFTSVMYDGSQLPEKENTQNTKEAVNMAEKTGASVEGEIGSMGTREGGSNEDSSIYTDPTAAKNFVQATGIDALACAFGTAHGFYKKAPRLDFDRLTQIRAQVGIPLVMHGGSGVSEQDYRKAIHCGIRKINYYTYMAGAGGAAISNKKYAQLHDALLEAEKAMREDVKRAMRIFSGL